MTVEQALAADALYLARLYWQSNGESHQVIMTVLYTCMNTDITSQLVTIQLVNEPVTVNHE